VFGRALHSINSAISIVIKVITVASFLNNPRVIRVDVAGILW
jgi:hypothetical protein